MSRLSVRTKLPLAMSAVILVVGASIATAAWFVIHRTSYEGAEERLTTLRGTFSRLVNQIVTGGQTRATTVARRPEIAAFFSGGSTAEARAALADVPRQGGQSPVVRTELRDPTGALELAVSIGVDRDGLTVSPTEWQELIRAIDPDADAPPLRQAVTGRLRRDGDAVFYPVVAPVPASEGYYVEWRRLGGSEQSRNSIAELLGSDAVILVGNADGSAWTDLGSPLSSAMPPLISNQINRLSRPDRGEVLAAVGDATGAPWQVAVEFPVEDVEAPARRFLRAASVIVVAAIGLGVLVGWGVGRRITAPVESLTTTVDAIARGDINRRVPMLGDDEFGTLGRSFNAMADEVQRSRDTLEETVAERTRELREARESLARKEKLTLIAHLAGGVGHEIRNPLGVMSNAIYYLEAVQKDAPKEVRDYLALLRQQVNITAKIVNDLLDMSRTTPASRQVVSVKDLVEPRLERLKGAVVERDLPADLPAVQVDPVHAGQVLDNLLENAVQAMGGAGTIRVRARERGDGFVSVEVADTGPGIRPEHIDKVFEPLFTTKARGIGLGLAVSKSLAQANGGDLALASAPGEGARFAFTMPVAGSTT